MHKGDAKIIMIDYKYLTETDNPRSIFIAEAGINHDGDIDKAKEMIDNDLNINVQYFNTGDTALIKAVKNSDQLLVELLLDNGADTGIKNWAGLTAKELAVDKSILKLLK